MAWNIFKNLGWNGLYSDTTSRDTNLTKTTNPPTPKPTIQTLEDKIRSIKPPHWCRIYAIESDYGDNYYGGNYGYERDRYERDRYERRRNGVGY